MESCSARRSSSCSWRPHSASQCRGANHTGSDPVCHHGNSRNDHSNRDAYSDSDCHAGSDAAAKRDCDANDATDGGFDCDNAFNSDEDPAHPDERSNGVSNQDRERDRSANGDSDRDTGSQANAHNDANSDKHADTYPATERKREGVTGACAGRLDEHHL